MCLHLQTHDVTVVLSTLQIWRVRVLFTDQSTETFIKNVH